MRGGRRWLWVEDVLCCAVLCFTLLPQLTWRWKSFGWYAKPPLQCGHLCLGADAAKLA